MLTDKKITILGANSYIARNLLQHIYVNFPSLSIKLFDLHQKHMDGFEPYTAVDLLHDKLADIVDFDCDALFVFTGKTGTSQGFVDPGLFVDINEKVLLNVLSAYMQTKSRAKIIFPSTRLLYKGSDATVKEDAEKEFKTVYALNKFACEQYLKMYHDFADIRYAVFRLCVPYGNRVLSTSSYGIIEMLTQRAKEQKKVVVYGDGMQKRTFTHIDDLCSILLEGALDHKCENDVFNIGGQALSIRYIAQKIAQKYKAEILFEEWPEAALKIESGHTVFDSQKLDSILQHKYTGDFDRWIDLEC